MLEHWELAGQSLVPSAHSSLSLHSTPSPSKPLLQAQSNDPSVLVHVASALQLSVPSVHSSISGHEIERPKPVIHAQSYEPSVLVQIALASPQTASTVSS